MARALIKAMMADQRYSDAKRQTWNYRTALFLYGQHLVWQRTGDPGYLRYLKDWGSANVGADGVPLLPEEGRLPGGDCNRNGRRDPLDAAGLDYLNPGRIAIILFRLTGQQRYRLAARRVWDELNLYPRTSDRGFWHACKTFGELWADGAYMSTSFLLSYAQAFAEARIAALDEAARQLEIYASHLQDPATGLLRHAYDETLRDRDPDDWTPGAGNLSSMIWCRAVGWYGVSLVDTLAALPVSHPRRAALLERLRRLASGLQRHQDAKTGRWFEVMDRGADPRNRLETSCSAMHAYVLARAVSRGWLGSNYRAIAAAAVRGVLDTITLNGDGTATIGGITPGTKVGDDLAHYVAKAHRSNDLHGVGAFLIMYEQIVRSPLAPTKR